MRTLLTQRAVDLLGPGSVLVTPCLGYSLPCSSLTNASCPALTRGRVRAASSAPLPCGFRWGLSNGRFRQIKGWEEGDVGIILLPCALPLGCCSSSAAVWLEPRLTVGAPSPVRAPILCEPSYLGEPLFCGSSSCETLQWEPPCQLSSDSSNPHAFPWPLQPWGDNGFRHCRPLGKIPC